MSLAKSDFKVISDYIHKICGIVVSESKSYLIEQRIQPLLNGWDVQSFADLAEKIQAGKTLNFRIGLIEAITTNETSFFRDSHPFEAFESTVLPDIIKRITRGERYEILCAGCSTGQEPYTLAMLIHSALEASGASPLTMQRVKIHGLDISHDALKKAKEGAYTALDIRRGMPVNLIQKYMRVEGQMYRIVDEIRPIVNWKQINLCDPLLVLPKPVQMIFSRNVLIYFDPLSVERIVRKYEEILEPGGYLVLGSSESLRLVGTSSFENRRIEGSCYYQKM